MLQQISGYGKYCFCGICAGKLCLGLAFKNRIRVLDSHNSRHAVSGVRSGKVRVLLLENTELSCIGIDELGKTGLKANQMGAAFLGKDVVAEAQDIFLKGIHKLESNLYLDLIYFLFEINRLMNDGLSAI